MLSVALTVVCAAACAWLVAGEHYDKRAWRRRAKPIASAAFLALGVVHALAADTRIAWCIVAGQVLGAAGDVLLMESREEGKKHWFLFGVFAFLAGHVAYIVGFATVVSPLRWPRLAGWTIAGPIWAAFQTARQVRGAVKGPLATAVIAYAVVITVMLVGAIALMSHGGLPGRIYLWAGAVLFFLSDIAVAYDLIEPDKANKLWGLPAYYAGQLLIAWAIGIS